jgi:hypothetical protein
MSPTLVCVAVDRDIVFCEKQDSDLVERRREPIGELVEVVRAFNNQLFVGTENGWCW